MMSYCIRCKKETKCINNKIIISKNNRSISRSNCIDCNRIRNSFIKSGSIEIPSKWLPLLPKKGLTLPDYKYYGPGNPLKNGKPVNELDAICERHDYCYSKPG